MLDKMIKTLHSKLIQRNNDIEKDIELSKIRIESLRKEIIVNEKEIGRNTKIINVLGDE